MDDSVDREHTLDLATPEASSLFQIVTNGMAGIGVGVGLTEMPGRCSLTLTDDTAELTVNRYVLNDSDVLLIRVVEGPDGQATQYQN